MGRLDDRVILITGGAKGQGAAEAELASEEGARVIVADVADEAGVATAAAVGGSYQHLDVSSAANWATAVESVTSQPTRSASPVLVAVTV